MHVNDCVIMLMEMKCRFGFRRVIKEVELVEFVMIGEGRHFVTCEIGSIDLLVDECVTC